jgi:hypothetical protein
VISDLHLPRHREIEQVLRARVADLVIVDRQGRPLDSTESRCPGPRHALDVDFEVGTEREQPVPRRPVG